VTNTVTFSFGDDAPELTNDWLKQPNAVFLYSVERLAGCYAGTPEAHAIREEMINSPVVQEMAEDILAVCGDQIIWTHALIRVGCKRAIEKRRQTEEEARATERVHIQDKWGRF
jgi:hypothetical protein